MALLEFLLETLQPEMRKASRTLDSHIFDSGVHKQSQMVTGVGTPTIVNTVECSSGYMPRTV